VLIEKGLNRGFRPKIFDVHIFYENVEISYFLVCENCYYKDTGNETFY